MLERVVHPTPTTSPFECPLKTSKDPLLFSPTNSICSTAAPDSDEEIEDLDISEFIIVKKQKKTKKALKVDEVPSLPQSSVLEESCEVSAPTEPVDSPVPVISNDPETVTKPGTDKGIDTTKLMLALVMPLVIAFWLTLIAFACFLVWCFVGTNVFIAFCLGIFVYSVGLVCCTGAIVDSK